MKRTLIITLVLTLILGAIFCLPANAAQTVEKTETTIQYLDNGDYIETVITYYETNSRVATKSGSKTSTYNSGGEDKWSVTVNGTFTYNGTTSSCTSSSRSTSVYASNWSIKSSTASKSGNCASATATATHKILLVSSDYTLTVNLYCSPYGILS